MTLIPGFTLCVLSIQRIDTSCSWQILKAMYVSYSRLYSRHYVPNAGTPLAVGRYSRQCMSLIPDFTLGITYPMQGYPLLLVILKTMYICLLFKALLYVLRTLLVLLLAIVKAVYDSYSWLYTLCIKYPTHRHLLQLADTQGNVCLLFQTLLSALRTQRRDTSCSWQILKAMYVSYSRLYSRHYVPNAGTPLAVGRYSRQCMSLIPDFTLGITYPMQGHPLLLADTQGNVYVSCSREQFSVQGISQVMDNSCSRIYPRH